ncbi:MAG: 16S rRNA (cytosine(967)-C(5))-methyltransferase RsmB [Coxiellaceae bacterium]|nr:16S rRNA (cytosine(967)-C(5))-methyltransferase RsmB [Coxiellaceae bacterium]
MNSRAVAAGVIHEVIDQQHSMSQVLPKALAKIEKAEDRAFVQEVSYGCLRWYPQLQAVANQLLYTPLKSKNHDVLCLLLTGIYQLMYLKTPAYAAVSETVAASKQMKKPWAAKLINKTLRQFSNNVEQVINESKNGEITEHAHPVWLVKRVKQAYAEKWTEILRANNTAAPMFLRINKTKTNREEYLKLLSAAEIAAEPIEFCDSAIRLTQPVAVDKLPGFNDGLAYVQDLSGQLVADLLKLEPNVHVLDACSAPGSKSTHIIECQPSVHLTAVDNQANRLPLIKQNIERLGLPHNHLHMVLADVCHTDQWWQGEKFDRILVDAPCSATGVIRRHPDIKWLRQNHDIDQLVQQQARILDKVWELLKPGGLLVYTTCSILPDENQLQVKRFLNQHKDAKLEAFEMPVGFAVEPGWQLLPSEDGGDGFYYAKLRKK